MDPFHARQAALHADLHQLTSAAACWGRGFNPRATFEISLARLPPGRTYMVAAGMEEVVRFLLDLEFEDDQVHFVRNLYAFHQLDAGFWEHLAALRFSGDLWTAPEGTPVFPREPFIRVTAPLIEGFLIEGYLRAMVTQQTLVASRALRFVQAAGGKELIDFGSAQSHGPAAGVLAARSAYIAGFTGTSNIEAAQQVGIPIFTRMPANFATAFPSEAEAYHAYAAAFPKATTLILDSYGEPLRATRQLIDLDLPARVVWIETGDGVQEAARAVRSLLDEAGKERVSIMAGYDLDERRIEGLVAAEAPIDIFATGAEVSCAADTPTLDLRYDLVAIEDGDGQRPVARATSGLPAVKQVRRHFGLDGKATSDVITIDGEKRSGAPVMSEVLAGGEATVGRPGIDTIRNYTSQALARLPQAVSRLSDPESYPVTLSDELEALRGRIATEATEMSEAPTGGGTP